MENVSRVQGSLYTTHREERYEIRYTLECTTDYSSLKSLRVALMYAGTDYPLRVLSRSNIVLRFAANFRELKYKPKYLVALRVLKRYHPNLQLDELR